MRTSSFLVCLVVVLLFLPGCGDNGPAAHCDRNLPERGVWKTPIYPDAQEISNEEGIVETISLLTKDAPDKVYPWYDELLKKSGWKPDLGDHVYGVANCCYFGSISISAEPDDIGRSKVTIKTFWSQGCG